MKLEEIILSLNKNNLSSLFARLSKSKCPKARVFVEKLIRGEDFYHSLAECFDKIGAQMLALGNFTGIRLLQKYLLFRNHLRQQLKFALFYPIIILIIQVTLLIFISSFLKINWWHLIWIFCLNVLVILGIYYYLYSLQRDLLLFHLFENLLNNNLDYQGFRACYLLFREPRVNVLELRSLEDFASAYLGISYVNQEDFLEKKAFRENKIKNLLKQVPKLVAGLLSINIVILCLLSLFAYGDFLGKKILQLLNKRVG